MEFKSNVAVFIDVENLFHGYGSNFDVELGKNLLSEAIDKIKENLDSNQYISVQRAYANWSDIRLSPLRRYLLDASIDPIQIFNLDNSKDVADINLAIDVIDFVHRYKHLDIFIIVSGDGGFLSIYRKLHEYGKKVVGVGIKNQTSAYLKSNCDLFINIGENIETTTPVQPNIFKGDLQKKRTLVKGSSLTDVKAFVVDIVNDNFKHFDRDDKGNINLSSVLAFIQQCEPTFSYKEYGFKKFVDAMRYFLFDTPYILTRNKEGVTGLFEETSHPPKVLILSKSDNLKKIKLFSNLNIEHNFIKYVENVFNIIKNDKNYFMNKAFSYITDDYSDIFNMYADNREEIITKSLKALSQLSYIKFSEEEDYLDRRIIEISEDDNFVNIVYNYINLYDEIAIEEVEELLK